MKQTLILTGDINLMGVTNPKVPFAKVATAMNKADVVFSNLECCFYDSLENQPSQKEFKAAVSGLLQREGFHASAVTAEALKIAGVSAIGNANNVNYGDEVITNSNAIMDRWEIPHTGAGKNLKQAKTPAIVESKNVRFGMVQRTCVYWPNNHEAGLHNPGVAAIKVHTAYRPQIDHRAANRPGVQPEIITWTDPEYLADFSRQIKALKKKCHIAVASIHWGNDDQVYNYQTELAHAAIDAGADVVMGHGPHIPLAIATYKNKPIYYGMGSFSFNIGHRGHKHPDWVGLMGKVKIDSRNVTGASFQFVRHNNKNETILKSLKSEKAEFDNMRAKSQRLGTILKARGDEIVFLKRK
jgi:poly-gamma-glutamate capsule biosynthesis protein CapA/YwtB (metallophosphatase superfamily)